MLTEDQREISAINEMEITSTVTSAANETLRLSLLMGLLRGSFEGGDLEYFLAKLRSSHDRWVGIAEDGIKVPAFEWFHSGP